MSLKVIHKYNDMALVKGKGNSFPVHLQNSLKNKVNIGDIAIVRKSPVSGEWIMTGFRQARQVE